MGAPIPDVSTIIGSGLLAQRERLSLIASNMANADSITTPGGRPYRAEEPVFAAEPAFGGAPADVVRVVGVVRSSEPPKLVYDPGSAYANAKGYVQESNVDPAQQMTDLISTTQSYSADIALLDQAAKLSKSMLQSFIA